ncbi:endonuclease/exonuclease/phosphatase family metal-dependent hydrolase [Actinoplanes campanulatus]|uniref:Endonuclease/exonuclease/phosphatase family metal-dependent hydrolase n=1 Tax=Actinoplanes campanulatus TaxID=113559 RepID=A0A7W5AL53_9ACTN|nr:endonuclease/exonuclease/phosphatase family protein [Actinoplanes campanulatus]MBB3098121.1 endonuclease/exonuclease/phosphatase family metal-dependent hydrolase [Actinoplanes campanulatus]GGN32499.1 endonuclease [Actinoplanes campanulatus]GID40007.1 endonuclease [Actinoplanes campanulatus]
MTVTDAPPGKRPSRGRTALSVAIWLLLTPGALWLVGRAFGLERGPLITLFAATPYVAAATLIPLLAALAAKRWRAAAVAGLVAAGMGACVLPRAVPDFDKGPAEGVALRVLTLNTLYGEADPAQIVQLVRDNDVAVLAVQEFTPDGEAALKAAGIGELLPHQQLSPAYDAGGSGLYSRHPMLTRATRRNDGGFQQAYATIQPPGAVAVHVESVHPLAPVGPEMYPRWSADLREQPHAGTDGPPPILLGDFNATLDHAELRDLIGTGYRDAADAVGEGLTTTWPSFDGSRGLVTIDHVLADERIGVRDVEVHTVRGSDHRAVLASLTLPAG